MKMTFDINGVVSLDHLADEARRVATLLNDGFTSGQIVGEEGEHVGWWEIDETERS